MHPASPLVLLSLVSLSACDGWGNWGKNPEDSASAGIALDRDGDGYNSDEDCDDTDPSVHPGAFEACDGVDNDCDGQVDEDLLSTWYQDADGDGFGDPATGVSSCEKPEGYVPTNNDCDDANANAFPGATEVCDGQDNDCDNEVDEDLSGTWYRDADGDGYGTPNEVATGCAAPTGFVDNPSDCDDTNAAANPGATEVCDGIDNDCDNEIDEGLTGTWYADRDGDSYGDPAVSEIACAAPPGFVADATDCDDAEASVHPGAAEVCNGRDDDCNGVIDDNAVDFKSWYEDADGDGYGDAGEWVVGCEPPSGYVDNGTDCDDTHATAHPDATEVCDGIDNDCDGTVDEDDAADATTWYHDADGDGYGDAGSADTGCSHPSDYVPNDDDCDDGNAAVNPAATEICNGIDDDCDGTVDEADAVGSSTWYYDGDGDGYGTSTTTVVACEAPTGYVPDDGDCNDTDAFVNPSAYEVCDGADNDCDGTVDEDDATDATTWYHDGDGDGYGDPGSADTGCTHPSDYVPNDDDCDDTSSAVHPGATEICDGRDNDCDGAVDEGATDATTWYADTDGDGYGDPGTSVTTCTPPTGWVTDHTDCDDTHATVHPGGTEVCDGLDNDCNGIVDDNPVDGTIWYVDADGDGFGDPDHTTLACSEPSGYTDNTWDCDDSEPEEPVVVDIVRGASGGLGTEASPLDSIQAGVDQADLCVVVYPGIYRETVEITGKSIDVWGVEGTDDTFIDPGLTPCTPTNPDDCEAAVTIASASDATPTLRGFTIRGGTGHTSSYTTTAPCADSSSGGRSCTINVYEYCGGGIYVNGDDPTLEDLVIEENILPEFVQEIVGEYEQTWLYSYGGGLCSTVGTVTVDDVLFDGNFADQGGGLYAGAASNILLTHSIFHANSATDGGAANVENSYFYATNAIFYCNAAETDGGALFVNGRAAMANVTNAVFWEDTSAAGSTHGAMAYGATSTELYVMNSIVQTSTAAYSMYGRGTGSFSYNQVYHASGSTWAYGGTYATGTGDLFTAPSFMSVTCDGNPDNDDFGLGSTSAAIDAGNPSPSYRDVDGTRNNMGAMGGPGGSWE